MIVNLNKNKQLIISHIADVDGLSSVILAKLHYENIDYCLVEIAELECLLKKLIEEDIYKNYDSIFITDLALRPMALKLIDENDELKKKIKHFDHHMTELDSTKKYSFVNVVNEMNGKLTCGTTLFYEYIKDTFKYKSNYLDKYLEAVRSYDSEGPLCNNKYGNDLTTLFSLIGIERFMEKIELGIKNKIDPLTDEDLEILKLENQKMEDYINQCDCNLIKIKLNGYNVGVVIAEFYKSSVGNRLSLRHSDLDYILVVNFMRNQFSLRTVKAGINVGFIAKNFTSIGGGHEKAAGMPINGDTIFIFDIIMQEIKKKYKK